MASAEANFFDFLVCLKNVGLFGKKAKSGIFGVYWPCWLLFGCFAYFPYLIGCWRSRPVQRLTAIFSTAFVPFCC